MGRARQLKEGDLLAMLPRLEQTLSDRAWSRSQTTGEVVLEQSRPGRSPELSGIRPGSPEDPWKIVRWDRWLTQRQRQVRDFQETVRTPSWVVLGDSRSLREPQCVAEFVARQSFGILTRSLLSGQPAGLATTGGPPVRIFERRQQLPELAAAVLTAITARGRGSASDMETLIRRHAPENSAIRVLVGADIAPASLRRIALVLRDPRWRCLIYTPVAAIEFNAPPPLIRSAVSGVIVQSNTDHVGRAIRRLDRLASVGRSAGVSVEPLVISNAAEDVWPILFDEPERTK